MSEHADPDRAEATATGRTETGRARTVVMTGGHAGIGFVGAHTLATRYACDLILTGRDPERIETAAARIRRDADVRIDVVAMDLNSLDSVRAGAARCRTLLETAGADLASVVCNAGAQFFGPVSYSVDGYEETFAGNCLGHFLLVTLLVDALAPTGRLVWTTSGTHDPASMDGKTVGAAVEPNAKMLAAEGRAGKPISGGRRYATSKLCTVLYAYEFARRLRRGDDATASLAYDPGFIPETGLGRGAPPIFRSRVAKYVMRRIGVTMGRMPESGEALARLAADADFAGASAKYFQCKDGALVESQSSTASYDEPAARALWADSEELARVTSAERPHRFRVAPVPA